MCKRAIKSVHFIRLQTHLYDRNPAMNNEKFKQMFSLGEKNDAYAQYFTGQSYLAVLATGGDANVVNVTFEPGCRNHWHIHHGSHQILICTAGEGWYQEEGKSAQRMRPGDVVDIACDVKHWHGATSDSWFSDLSVSVPKEGSSNEWCEPVSDEEYARLQ